MTRTVTSSIQGLTIVDVRKALQFIRRNRFDNYDKLIHKKLTSEDVCLKYLLGLHMKRRNYKRVLCN